jgi:hypothetical protein
MAADSSPKELRAAIAALDAFRAAYVAFLEGDDGDDELRQAVHNTMPAAQRALNTAQLNIQVADPPALGAHRQVYSGLATLAFMHEHPGWESSGVPGMVLDNLDGGRARLEDQRVQAAARRRSPLFWIDCALRALLMVPAYLVGLIVGESPLKIDRSAWGLPLRLLAILADGLAIYFAGRAFGWW